MKLVTLNIWEGEILEPLKNFITNQSTEVDIFCFQEVLEKGESNIFELIQSILPSFDGYFSQIVPGTGLVTFVKKNLKVEKVEASPILFTEEVKHLTNERGQTYYPRIIQIVSLSDPKVFLFNFHGIPGNLKRDTPEREIQTKRLHKILEKYPDPKILVGDFNLSPDTNAISALENNMVNLMKGSSYNTTRTKFYERKEVMPFADYIFTSPDIEVMDFAVLPDEISDHSPLFVKFEI